jgi:F0F1-type ATP synthase membrane subunit b/b'
MHGTRTQAAELHAKTDSRLTELDAQLKGARLEITDFRAKARAKALANESAILAAARQKAEGKVNEAVEQITIEQAAASKTLKSISEGLSDDIVNQVLGRQASA